MLDLIVEQLLAPNGRASILPERGGDCVPIPVLKEVPAAKACDPSAGDVVILDNLAAHKSPKAEAAIKARGAWMLFLPPYSPDLNPIEMPFSKLKANLRARAIRTIDGLWQAIGDICNLYSPAECKNYFDAAGYI